jgi:hypothetical protein
MPSTFAHRFGFASVAFALIAAPALSGTLTLAANSLMFLGGYASGEISHFKNDSYAMGVTTRETTDPAAAPAMSGYVDAKEGKISLSARSEASPGGSYTTQTGVYEGSASGGLTYKFTYAGEDLALPEGWLSFMAEGDYGFGAPDYKVTFTSSLDVLQYGSAFPAHIVGQNEQHAPSGMIDDAVSSTVYGGAEWTEVRSTPGRFEVAHTAPGFTLRDGDRLEIWLRFQLSARAYPLPAGVNHAFADGSNTGALSLMLPDTVALDVVDVLGPSAPGFVVSPSQVPLPPAGLLMAGGLAALGLARRRDRQG